MFELMRVSSGRGPDLGHDRGDRGPDPGCVPARGTLALAHWSRGDRGQRGRVLPPSNPQRIAVRRDEARSSELRSRAADSSSLHATYSGFRPGTSNPRPRRIRGRGSRAASEPREVPVADQF